MSFYQQFRTFDPITGTVPISPFEELRDIAQRARSLLKGRSIEECESAAEIIDWMIDDFFETDQSLHGEQATERGDLSEVSALRQCLDSWSVVDDPTSPLAKTHEYFAVLALWMIADALEWAHRGLKALRNRIPSDAHDPAHSPNLAQDQSPHVDDHVIDLCLAGRYAIKAMDAVAYAEQLLNLDHVHLRQATQRSIQSQQANIERHRKTNEVKALVLREWEKDRTRLPSAEKAGSFYADWLEEKGHRYEQRTVRDWIRVRAKELRLSWR